ncbi:hypothetical protein [Flavobacterium sp. ANB]|uniref:hypothetical protein n=1 Tax=unclassified Flavobacterium TaxID=196869 RepID=UPI00293BD1C7|nr:hypothetical protein [Flavobacterium sp. ANB]
MPAKVEIIRLKGSLISKGYTEIIYILYQDNELNINSLEATDETKSKVQEFIKVFVIKENMADTISLFK